MLGIVSKGLPKFDAVLLNDKNTAGDNKSRYFEYIKKKATNDEVLEVAEELLLV